MVEGEDSLNAGSFSLRRRGREMTVPRLSEPRSRTETRYGEPTFVGTGEKGKYLEGSLA